jgi:enoyl-CoA hydratase
VSIRGVLVTAEGERAFCAGADIIGWGALSPTDFARHWVRLGHRVFDRLARLSRPTVAVIAGTCLRRRAGTGHGVRHPGDGAKATLGLPEAQVGIVPGWSGTQRLARLLPEPVLKEMALFGRRLSAERAHALGYVAEVSDDPRRRQWRLPTGCSRPRRAPMRLRSTRSTPGVGEDRAR